MYAALYYTIVITQLLVINVVIIVTRYKGCKGTTERHKGIPYKEVTNSCIKVQYNTDII